MKKLSLLTKPKFGPLGFAHAIYALVPGIGEAQTAKVFIREKVGSSLRVILS